MLFTVMIFSLYGMMMFWFYTGIKRTKNNEPISHITPKISVVVSLRNESENIQTLVNGLLNLKYPGSKLEIILVNDHSTDNTFDLLKSFESNRVMVLNNTGEGKKQAIETAVKKANGDWVLVSDADCMVPKYWVESMVNSIKPETKMVLGPVFIKEANSFLEQLQSIEFFGLQGSTCGSAGIGKPISANAANMLFKKDVFEELNPYQNNYNLKTGDDQFLLMAVASSYPNSVVYSMNKDSIIFTHPVNNWSKYFSQRIRWASKGSAYTQSFPKMVGILVFLTSLVIVFSMFYAGYFRNWSFAILPFSIKILADFLVVIPMKKFSGNKINPVYYLLSAILYPFVVIFSVLGGFLKK